MGKEIEVDAVCDGEEILIPGIMEHIERAGIHSGDSISVYPAQTISQTAKETIAEYTQPSRKGSSRNRYDQYSVYRMWRRSLCNRGKSAFFSRTVPYISKVTGIPIVPLATKVILGIQAERYGI